MNLNIEKD